MTQGSMPTTGRWGWYRDHEGNEFRRVSTLIKKVEADTYHLDLWKQRQVLVGAARRDDLITAIKAMGDPDPATGWTREQKKLQNELAAKAAEAAKDTDGAITGTAVHTLTERLDRGEPLERIVAGLPALLGSTVRAYAALRELNGWQTVEIERTVVCDELEVAGTFDRVDVVPGLAAMLGPGNCQHRHSDGEHDPDGELPVIVDVKTEERPWLNGLHIAPQLGIYSRARRMWTPTGYVPAPCVRQDVAIVVHLRDGAAVPILVNLAEGWEAAVAAYEQMNRESRAKRDLGVRGAWFAPLPGVIKPRPAQLLVDHAVAAGYASPDRPAAGEVGEVKTVAGIDFTRLVSAEVAWGATTFVPPSGAEVVGGHGPMPDVVREAANARADLTAKLIEAIWKAMTVDGLGILWNMAQDRGVPWTGPVAQAAEARRRQIECPQRFMSHVPGTVKCACGWLPAVPA